MRKVRKITKNYLDFIPKKNTGLEWRVEGKTKVIIDIKNLGFYNKLAQKLFKRPTVSHIELDEFGSYIWGLIDGKKDIYTISKLVSNNFGDKAEPLYERLVKFFQVLHENKLTEYLKKEDYNG